MARKRGLTANRSAVPGSSGDVPTDDPDLQKYKTWFKAARDHSQKWRIEARMCFDFVAGHQWDDTDRALLELTNRPIITFNRVGTTIDTVSGLEVTNRQEVRYIPRQLGASGVNDLLTSAGKWCRDECNAEDEESDAFVDLIVCGMGWSETRLDYDEDPQGLLKIVRIDPLEMFWDSSGRQRNIANGKHIFRVREVTVAEAEEEFPGEDADDIDAKWAKDALSEAKTPHDAMQAPYYRNDQSPDIDKQTRRITIVEMQWWELEKAHRVIDPESGKVKTVNPAEFKTLQNRYQIMQQMVAEQGLNSLPPLESDETKKRVYKRAILGRSKVLKKWDGPKEGGFTLKCMTGKRDRNTGTWYGLVRAMVDPQKWANKWLSQVLHIVNSNAKGGYWAEADAFENPQEAMETMADPASVTLLTPGTLQNKKIQPKEQVQYPEGIDRLMQFAIMSIRETTGVNLEMLGLAQKDQPGILEHQRKQAGMTILAGLFDSLRHYRKDQGKLMLWYITNFLSDGRLVRIGGQENAQYVPLVHQPGIAEYDVIVDDTATSTNQKEQTWAILVQMFPVLAKVQAPLPVWLTLLEYSPLPSSLVAKLNEMMQQAPQQQADPKMIEAQANVQATQIKSQAEMMRAGADVQVSKAKAYESLVKAHSHAHEAQANAAATQHEAVSGANTQAIEMLIGAMLQSQQNEAANAIKEKQAMQKVK